MQPPGGDIADIVARVFSDIRQDVDRLVSSALDAAPGTAQPTQPQRCITDDPPQHRGDGTAVGQQPLQLHGRTLSEAPGYGDDPLAEPLMRLPEALPFDGDDGTVDGASAAAAAAQPCQQQHTQPGGGNSSCTVDLARRQEAATAPASAASDAGSAAAGSCGATAAGAPAACGPCRELTVDSVDADASSSSHVQVATSYLTCADLLDEAGAGAGSNSNPATEAAPRSSSTSRGRPASGGPKQQQQQPAKAAADSVRIFKQGSATASQVLGGGRRLPVAATSDASTASKVPQRSRSAPRQAAVSSSSAPGASLLSPPLERQQQQQQAMPRASSNPRGTMQAIERLYALGVEKQAKRSQPAAGRSTSPVRLTEDEWQRATRRLYEDARAKEERMRLRRELQADEQPGAGSAASADGAAAACSGAGGSKVLQRQTAGSDSFHQRQNALVQRRAERALQKQPDDEQELEECTFHPAINAASKVLHRGVEELHKWDARRRWHVSEMVAQKSEHELDEYTFEPETNTKRNSPRERRGTAAEAGGSQAGRRSSSPGRQQQQQQQRPMSPGGLPPGMVLGIPVHMVLATPATTALPLPAQLLQLPADAVVIQMPARVPAAVEAGDGVAFLSLSPAKSPGRIRTTSSPAGAAPAAEAAAGGADADADAVAAARSRSVVSPVQAQRGLEEGAASAFASEVLTAVWKARASRQPSDGGVATPPMHRAANYVFSRGGSADGMHAASRGSRQQVRSSGGGSYFSPVAFAAAPARQGGSCLSKQAGQQDSTVPQELGMQHLQPLVATAAWCMEGAAGSVAPGDGDSLACNKAAAGKAQQQRQPAYAAAKGRCSGTGGHYSAAQWLNALQRSSSCGGVQQPGTPPAWQQQRHFASLLPAGAQAAAVTGSHHGSSSGSGAPGEACGASMEATGGMQRPQSCVPDADDSSDAREMQWLLEQRAEGMLDDTRSMPLELTASPRACPPASGADNGSYDGAAPQLTQQLLVLLAQAEEGGAGAVVASNMLPGAVGEGGRQPPPASADDCSVPGSACCSPESAAERAAILRHMTQLCRTRSCGSDSTCSSFSFCAAAPGGLTAAGSSGSAQLRSLIASQLRPAAGSPFLPDSREGSRVSTPHGSSNNLLLQQQQQLQVQQRVLRSKLCAASGVEPEVAACCDADMAPAAPAEQQQPGEEQEAPVAAAPPQPLAVPGDSDSAAAEAVSAEALVALLFSPGLTPQDKAQRVAKAFSRTISRNRNWDVASLEETLAAFDGPAAAAAVTSPRMARDTSQQQREGEAAANEAVMNEAQDGLGEHNTATSGSESGSAGDAAGGDGGASSSD